jgi:hypothetical protein
VRVGCARTHPSEEEETMFAPADPTAQPDFQIDPFRSPLFQILQPQIGSDTWAEVGFVWTIGSSRTNSTEHWYLYSTVTAGSPQAAYTWPGYDANGRVFGANLRLVPSIPPAGQTPDTMTAYLERANGVSLTHIRGTMVAG